MAELKEGLDAFEADKAETLVSEMSGAVYQGVSVEELLCDVRQSLDDFEFALASDGVETLIRKVEGGEAE